VCFQRLFTVWDVGVNYGGQQLSSFKRENDGPVTYGAACGGFAGGPGSPPPSYPAYPQATGYPSTQPMPVATPYQGGYPQAYGQASAYPAAYPGAMPSHGEMPIAVPMVNQYCGGGLQYRGANM